MVWEVRWEEGLERKVLRVQRVQRVQRVVDSRFAAMFIKSALRNLHLCHRWCMTKSKSPLPKEGGVAVGDGG